MEKSVVIPQGLSDYIEALQYDLDSLRDLLVRAASNGIENTEAHRMWLEDYKKAGREYQIAKNEVQTKYVMPLLGEDEKVDWTLDFDTHIVHITEAKA